MMKALEALVSVHGYKSVGNHAVAKIASVSLYIKHNSERVLVPEWREAHGFYRCFLYHGNKICLVDDRRKRIILTNAGWRTRSTARALNDYRRYFVEELGYTEW